MSNILLVVADLGLGGAQQVVINLANELINHNHRVWIYDVYPKLRKQGMVSRLNEGVELISKQYSEKSSALIERIMDGLLYKTKINRKYIAKKREREHFQMLKKVLKKERITIVNSHVWWADKFVFENMQSLHKNWWITLHGSYSYILKNKNIAPFFKEEAKQVLEKVKGVIYLSEEEKEKIQKNIKHNQCNFYKIYNGMSQPLNIGALTRKNIGLSDNDFVLLCASRAIKEKGWEELIQAVSLFNRKNKKKVHLLLAGDGPMLEEWKDMFASYKNVRFLGYRKDIIEIINLSDLVISLSYFEALPTILIESLFLSKPIIGTDVGETKNIIGQGDLRVGVLIEKKPKNEDVCLAISEIMDDENYRIFVNNTINARKQFEVENMVKQYLKCFNEG